MQTDEVDVALDELETRLERLRSLYEQYFLGIEKLEPSVARKDVDRRIWLLRREKIRNTAKRFKLQTIVQRYNTYQQYWQRILREIEAGTYHRHLLKAEKQFGAGALTIAARKRAGLFKRGEEAAQARATEQLEPTAAATVAAPETAESPAPAAQLQHQPAARATRDLGRLELDLDFGAAGPPPVASPRAAPPGPAPTAVVPAQVAAPPPATATAARPGPPPLPKRPALPAPATAPEVRPAAGGLSDQRVRELHERLLAARRETHEGSAVSVDGLARSLREAEGRLKARHGDRTIDFDVVIKGGKALVKPVIK